MTTGANKQINKQTNKTKKKTPYKQRAKQKLNGNKFSVLGTAITIWIKFHMVKEEVFEEIYMATFLYNNIHIIIKIFEIS